MMRDSNKPKPPDVDTAARNPLKKPADNPLNNPLDNPLKTILHDINIKSGESRYNHNSSYFQTHDLYGQPFDYGLDKERGKRSFARLLHLSPNAPSMDIFLDGRLFFSSMGYRMQSDYVCVRPGNHRIIIYPSGHLRNPIYYKTLFIPRRSIVSLIIYGLLRNMDVMVVDDKVSIYPGRVRVKFVHLSPKLPALDLLAGKYMMFNNVFYQESTEYITIPPGHESLSLRKSGTNQILMTLPNIMFTRNKAYTIYSIGLVKSSPSIEILTVVDGSGHLNIE